MEWRGIAQIIRHTSNVSIEAEQGMHCSGQPAVGLMQASLVMGSLSLSIYSYHKDTLKRRCRTCKQKMLSPRLACKHEQYFLDIFLPAEVLNHRIKRFYFYMNLVSEFFLIHLLWKRGGFVSCHQLPGHWWQEAAGPCAVTPVSPLALSGWSPSVLLCLIRLLSMQNNLPDGPSAQPPVADLP